MSHGLVKRLSLCICTALLVASCAKQNKQAFYNTGIIYCSESNPVTFNPQLDTSSTTSDASSHQLYDRLLDFDPESGRIVPSLASSWLVSDDGYLLTAGHVLGTEQPVAQVEVQFTEGPSLIAQRIEWKFDTEQENVDHENTRRWQVFIHIDLHIRYGKICERPCC